MLAGRAWGLSLSAGTTACGGCDAENLEL